MLHSGLLLPGKVGLRTLPLMEISVLVATVTCSDESGVDADWPLYVCLPLLCNRGTVVDDYFSLHALLSSFLPLHSVYLSALANKMIIYIFRDMSIIHFQIHDMSMK